ncbi:group II intron reverse transcriptase [Arthrospira platensis CENA650]|uniref:group II intron reverse transcriptase n=1 Tax=Limnospira platensis TaxID=118562 RepID=UPI003D6EC16B
MNHNYLLSKIQCPSSLKRDLKQWLKAGVLDNGVFEDTESGTPQGGVISPILANIALLGMERLVKGMYPNKGTTTQVNLIRYADDFVVISRDLGIIEQCKTAISEWLTQSALISRLNPIIRGWSNYYSAVVSKETFIKLDYIIWQMLRAWTVSRCGKASNEKLSNYFRHGTIKLSNGKERHENWLFQTKDGVHLFKHNWTPIVRHTLIRPDATPYDGNWTYWATRKGQAIDTPNRVAKLLKKQKGRCTWCGQFFTPSDLIEVDHTEPRSQGGKDEYKNLQLLHHHCHDDKTALDEEMMLYS